MLEVWQKRFRIAWNGVGEMHLHMEFGEAKYHGRFGWRLVLWASLQVLESQPMEVEIGGMKLPILFA